MNRDAASQLTTAVVAVDVFDDNLQIRLRRGRPAKQRLRDRELARRVLRVLVEVPLQDPTRGRLQDDHVDLDLVVRLRTFVADRRLVTLGRRHVLEQRLLDAALESGREGFPEHLVLLSSDGPGEVARVTEGQASDVEQHPPEDVYHWPNFSFFLWRPVSVVVEPAKVSPEPWAEVNLERNNHQIAAKEHKMLLKTPRKLENMSLNRSLAHFLIKVVSMLR